MTGYSISIPSVTLKFLVKLLLKFIVKVNKFGQIILFVAVLHAPAELVVTDHPKITGTFYNALISMGIEGNIAQIVCE